MKAPITALGLAAAAGAVAMLGGVLGLREYRRHDPEADVAVQVTSENRDFENISNAEGGMGPGYNGVSCGSCHNIPATGGSGLATTLRVARRDQSGKVHAYPGSAIVHVFSTPNHECRPLIPRDANVFSRRLPISTFGSGLIDAIPDRDLIALEDPQDTDGDGVSGRAARVFDRASATNRIGRFGWKAQQASLLAFAAEAYMQEMGVTNALYPQDSVIGVSAEQLRQCDTVADPEDQVDSEGKGAIDHFESFMKALPAPSADSTAEQAGALIFSAVGCASCHRPQVGAARAFSDFLLHDIGTGDGIAEADATGAEMRTAALWGIRHRSLYLHDGSAASIEEAIARHDREAAGARTRFKRLTREDQRRLVAFVSQQ